MFSSAFVCFHRIPRTAPYQRPPCESALCYFGADRFFPLFARPRRLARTYGLKSRHMRSASESLGRISAAKSRTVGLNSKSQRRRGRRLNLPGCVDTPMDVGLRSDSQVAGNFPCFLVHFCGDPTRKRRQVGEFLPLCPNPPPNGAGNFRPWRRECRIAKQRIFAGAAGAPRAKAPAMKKKRQRQPDSVTQSGIGYARPPKETRWKVGQSGNPRGRTPKPKVAPAELADTKEPPAKVGYKSPPVHSRWKPGQTGNPQGLPPRDILREVLMSPFPVKIGAKTVLAPALDVMLLRIKTRALAGDQKVIRSLIENFGSSALTEQLVRRSGDPEVIRLAQLERARPKTKRTSGRGDEGH